MTAPRAFSERHSKFGMSSIKVNLVQSSDSGSFTLDFTQKLNRGRPAIGACQPCEGVVQVGFELLTDVGKWRQGASKALNHQIVPERFDKLKVGAFNRSED